MKKILAALVLLSSEMIWAAPQNIEMIFLSPQKVAQLLDLINKKSTNSTRILLAADESAPCLPMGDGCFHPQLGFINRKPDVTVLPTTEANTRLQEKKEIQVEKDVPNELKTFNAVETNMINCDKGNYFDIYCGKTRPNSKPSEIEIWFDISSSLRAVDYSKDSTHCDRRTFMTRVMEGCKQKVKVMVYNTSIKEIGDHSSACMSYGTNDEKRLIQWLKESSAKRILIVTDIDEVSRAMRDFLEERGAKTIGDGVKPFSSTDLINYANDFTKYCKK